MGNDTNGSNGTTVVNVPKQTGMVTRDHFGGSERTQLAEMSSRASAEQARAMVESRYVMALRSPRDFDAMRVKILNDMKRPGFAEVARYSKPLGGGKSARGWTIRFAEAACRAMTNILQELVILNDDEYRRLFRIAVTDLEANITNQKDVLVLKQVERSNAKGRTVYGQRKNSDDRDVFIVEATEEEFMTKEASVASRIRRQLVLQHIPGDILDDCLRQWEDTQAKIAKGDATDPDAAKKRLIDSFATVGIRPDDLAKYLGHPVAQVVPGEMSELREIYAGLRDGDTTWTEVMATRADVEAGAQMAARTDSLRDRLPKISADLEASWKESPAMFERIVGCPLSRLDSVADFDRAWNALHGPKQETPRAKAEPTTIDVQATPVVSSSPVTQVQPTPTPAQAAQSKVDEAFADVPSDEQEVTVSDLNAACKAARGRDKDKGAAVWLAARGDRQIADLSQPERKALMEALAAITGGVS